ncbi:hypothetical protein ABZ404_34735 [Streptomyces sp. NPDC005878]|uniref:hypothetical protein n=1 Tax=Streptomyces sp. NPDC005878 TaxID=3157077 RepID=UPI0033E2C281
MRGAHIRLSTGSPLSCRAVRASWAACLRTAFSATMHPAARTHSSTTATATPVNTAPLARATTASVKTVNPSTPSSAEAASHRFAHGASCPGCHTAQTLLPATAIAAAQTASHTNAPTTGPP